MKHIPRNETGGLTPLTFNHVLMYTSRLALVLLTLSWLTGCGGEPIQCRDNGDCYFDPRDESFNVPDRQPSTPDVADLGDESMNAHHNQPPIPVHIIGEKAQGGGAQILPRVGGTTQEIRFQAKFAKASMHTLQFTVLDPNLTNMVNNEIIRAQALVTWSLGGQNILRRVDCVNGLSISGEAESVDVKITDRSVISNVPGRVINAYTVQVVAAEGTRPAEEQPPQFTGDTVNLGPVGGSSIEVPEGAISAWVTIAPQTLGPILIPSDHIVRQTTRGGVTLRAYSPLQVNGFVPLANGCTRLAFEQTALQPATVQYFTAFGIDG